MTDKSAQPNANPNITITGGVSWETAPGGKDYDLYPDGTEIITVHTDGTATSLLDDETFAEKLRVGLEQYRRDAAQLRPMGGVFLPFLPVGKPVDYLGLLEDPQHDFRATSESDVGPDQ